MIACIAERYREGPRWQDEAICGVGFRLENNLVIQVAVLREDGINLIV